MSYASLHNHDMYSVLDGFSTPEDYLKTATELGLTAFAITNHGNMYSWVYYDKLKEKYPEVKLLYGVELYECFDMKIKDNTSKYFHLIAIARNERGRVALNEIVTESNFNGFYYKPRVSLDFLKQYGDDLVITTACLGSKIARELDYDICIEYINEYKKYFPYFYLEMQSHSHDDQNRYNNKILKLSKDTNTPFIITTDSHCAKKEDLKYQNWHVKIAQDRETSDEIYEGCYLQSEDEIHSIMDSQVGADIVTIGLNETNNILKLIEDVKMPFQKEQLPHFQLPDNFDSDYDYLVSLTNEGWINRKFNNLSIEDQKIARERLDYELSIIKEMGFEGYFLIVWDIINFCKKEYIAVGVRGSALGSLLCYLISISDANPIKYNLIFERFLNPERISMPDIDVDVGDREKVIEYLINKYGSERVCQILNFSYITPTVAIRDVGKVLGFAYSITSAISQKFSYDTFEECVQHNHVLIEQNPQYKEWFDIASHISGKVRQVSVHAGGVGIVDTKITDYMAMKIGSNNEQVIQVDKRIVEEIGIIKFDILGVQTLNLVSNVVKEANITFDEIDINNPIFENDKKSYQLLAEAKTNAVFQVESMGMKDLLVRLKPESIEELSALIALYRPDSMSAIEDFIGNKQDDSKVTYIHDDMESILNTTYGCMIYQEQIMEIARTFGGRTYGGADKFRKGIGKKDMELVQKEAEILYQEIIDNSYEEPIAKIISDEMKEKGGYCFNKSHSIAYAILCLQTAYLKSHYPLQFFKVLLDQNSNDKGKINKYIIDALDFNIKILPPHINESNISFTIKDNNILFGLLAINGVGEKTVVQILEERNKNGIFTNIYDLKDRVGSLGDKIIIQLIKAGAIPSKNKRKTIINYGKSKMPNSNYSPVKGLPSPLSKLKNEFGIDIDKIKDNETRLSLYNEVRERKFNELKNIKLKEFKDSFEEKYLSNEHLWEFESLSVFLNNNPFEYIYDLIQSYESIENGNKAIIVGVIANIQKKKDKNKNKYCYLTIYSAYGIVELLCWSSQFKLYEDILTTGNSLAILVDKDEDKYFVNKIKPYEQWLIDTGYNKLLDERLVKHG